MARSICTVCGRKREDKFMLQIPIELIFLGDYSKMNVCVRSIQRNFNTNKCLITFIENVTEILERKSKKLQEFKKVHIKDL